MQSIRIFLFLVIAGHFVQCLAAEHDARATHIAANVPDSRAFSDAVSRDLLAYFRTTPAASGADRVEYELLRDEPTQSGISYPKYYAWVKAAQGETVLAEGAVRMTAVEKTHFEVTDFLDRKAAEDFEQVSAIFPESLAIRIIALAAVSDDSTHPAKPPVCDVAAYETKFGKHSRRTCIARIVAKRCNQNDSCQFVCQISGEWDEIGGGCDHMCNYGETFDLPAGTEVCNDAK